MWWTERVRHLGVTMVEHELKTEAGEALGWYVRLRWLAIGAQVCALGAAWVYGFEVLLPWTGAVVAIELLFAVALSFVDLSRRPRQEVWLIGLLCVDVVALVALLYLTGGPHNPMSVAVMVFVALAAVMLRPAFAVGVAAFTIGLSALLFVDSQPLELRAEVAVAQAPACESCQAAGDKALPCERCRGASGHGDHAGHGGHDEHGGMDMALHLLGMQRSTKF